LIKDGRNYKYIKFSAKPSKNLDMSKFIEEMNSKIENFNKLFKDVQISVDDKESVLIFSFQSAHYNSKNNKVVLVFTSTKGKSKSFEFESFEDAKSMIQKRLLI